MVRLSWLVHKEAVEADEPVVELEEFLRSVSRIDGEPAPSRRSAPGNALMLGPGEDFDETDALDDEATLSEEVALPDPQQDHQYEPLDEGLLEVPLSEPLPALDAPAAPRDVPPIEPHRVVSLNERLSEPTREPPPLEPRPYELDELLDEALSETFPASDPIAVSPARSSG
jgi:hypothetical protein